MKTSRLIAASLFCSTVALLVAGATVKAQNVNQLDVQYGSISGTVTGPDGKPAASVAVRIVSAGPQSGGLPNDRIGENADMGLGDVILLGRGETTIASARTDANGVYNIAKIRTGRFKVIVNATARTKQAAADVTIESGKKAVADLKVENRDPK